MQPIEKILTAAPKGVLSLTGGGGKTSLMFHLAKTLESSGKRVLSTTTTKIFVPTPEQSKTVLVDSDPQQIIQQVVASSAGCGHVTAAAAQRDGYKLKGFAPEAIQMFADSDLFDWIIVEADGSARRPLKAPAAHEPVVPDITSVHVAVAGLEVLGQPLNDELVFRMELAADVMDITVGDTLNAEVLGRLFIHPQGAFKGVPSNARRFIFLNKADDELRLEGAARIAKYLRSTAPDIAQAVIVGQAIDGVSVRAVHMLTGN